MEKNIEEAKKEFKNAVSEKDWRLISQVLLGGTTALLIIQLVVGVPLDIAFIAMGFSGMGWCPAVPVLPWYLVGKLRK